MVNSCSKKINIRVPKTWQDLTEEQLAFFFSQAASNRPLPEVLARCALRWARLKVLARTADGSCLVLHRPTRRKAVLAAWQLTFLARQLAFLETFPPHPVRLAKVQGAAAAEADLQGFPFADYLACENLYQGFLRTQSDACLSDMAHLLYPTLPEAAQPTRAELVSVFYWFASVKANFSRLFPHFFTLMPQEPGNLLATAERSVGEELRQAMNAQIRALTAGDITKEAHILATDCHRALTELDAKAREAEEMRRQYP